MDRVAVFDVDFTLTSRETQVELIRYLIRKDPALLRFLPNSLFAAVGNLLGLTSDLAAKEKNLAILRGMPVDELMKLSRAFFEEGIRPILYRDGLTAIHRHHAQGMRVILCSASPEFYIREFERSPYIEKAMGTRFLFQDGLFTARAQGLNNKGAEKVRRLKTYLKDTEIDWEHSVMYSDSLSDRPLMELMGHAYLINHRPDPDFPVLRWN